MKIARIINITAKSMEIAREVIPSTQRFVRFCVEQNISLDNQGNFRYFLNEFDRLIDNIQLSDGFSVNKLAQNNYELLDVMQAVLIQILSFSKKHVGFTLNGQRIKLLQTRIENLLEELNSPPFLQHQNQIPEASDENLQGEESNKDLTDPRKTILISNILTFSMILV